MWCAHCYEYFLPDRDYYWNLGSCPHCDQQLWGVMVAAGRDGRIGIVSPQALTGPHSLFRRDWEEPAQQATPCGG